MISRETASKILEALGPDSITAQCMDADELIEDLETFQTERTLRNDYRDWLSTLLMVERIHLETDPSFNTPELIAMRDQKLNQMNRRAFAVKLTGDEMKKTKKRSVTKSAAQAKSADRKKVSRTTKSPTATQPKTPAQQPVKTEPTPLATLKVGDEKLATEADFTTPSHSRLSDYRYYALVDNKSRVVGRGFLARVDNAPRRSWFALRNEEQTILWETSKWAIREIDFERYQQLTLEYLKAEGWPEFKSTRAKAA